MADPFSTPGSIPPQPTPAAQMGPSFSPLPPQPALRTRTMPIWAPTPGVPISARILSWSFAALIVLTIVLTFALARPADIPPMPNQWLEFKATDGTIPYPAGWIMHTAHEKEFDRLAVDLPPSGGVHIECSVRTLPVQADAMVIELIAKQANNMLESEYRAFQRVEDTNPSGTADVEQPFTYWDHHSDMKMAGVWMMRTRGDKLLLLFANCREEAYPALRQIANHIVTFTQLN